MSKYTLEIRDPSGTLLADFSGMARERRISKSRNEADEISWTLDLAHVEAYCRSAGITVSTLFTTGRNEVRVRRGSTYLTGGQLSYWEARSDARGKSLSLKATGFFNLLGSRYTSASFSATDAAEIAWQLIAASQAETYGNLGFTRGTVATPGLWNKSYARISLKEAIQDLSKSVTRGFDFEVTYNKVFNTYGSQGSDRSKDVKFEAPGNIIEWSLPNDATGLANEVIGIGSGNGKQAQTTYTGDPSNSDVALASQLTYGKRQKFLQRASQDDADGSLQDAVRSELDSWAFPIEVPSITVSGNVAPFITDYGIGDRVSVRLNDSDLAAHINGAYRIEKYDLDIDDNDNERISLSLSV